MKKFLPTLVRSWELVVGSKDKKSTNYELPEKRTTNQFGFTLIELMVVVVIIAILSIVGLSLYINIQKTARDSVRKQEIDSLAKSIEGSVDPQTGIYTYASAQFGNDYPHKKPKPIGGHFYCHNSSTTAGTTIDDPLLTDWPTSANCPTVGTTDWPTLVNDSSTFVTSLPLDTKSWKICARLENNTVYCVHSNR